MAERLAQYKHRAPRYILLDTDNDNVRAKIGSRPPFQNGTHLLNVSASGLAFEMNLDESLHIGDIVLLEFSAPFAKKMAVRTEVTRVDETSNRMIIGVTYCDLNTAQISNLTESLVQSLKRQRLKQKRSLTLYHWQAIGVIALSTVLYSISLYGTLNIPSIIRLLISRSSL